LALRADPAARWHDQNDPKDEARNDNFRAEHFF
jgi:hypothetical protein